MSPDIIPSSDLCLLHIVRHGSTPHNLLEPPRMQGHAIDHSLAPIGVQQAECIAEAMQACELAAVYASPLKRAMETAQAIAKGQQLETVAIDELVEANVGRWEDKSWPEIAASDAEAYRLYREDPATHGYPGGETLAEVAERVLAATREIALAHLGQQVAIVAHSVVNRVLLGEFTSTPLALRRHIPQSNCGWSVVRYAKEKARVLSLNEVQHLRACSKSH